MLGEERASFFGNKSVEVLISLVFGVSVRGLFMAFVRFVSLLGLIYWKGLCIG